MALKTAKKTGKKTRKYGRQKDSPAHQRYNNERRWNKNKIQRAKKLAKKFGKPIKIKIDGQWETIAA